MRPGPVESVFGGRGVVTLDRGFIRLPVRSFSDGSRVASSASRNNVKSSWMGIGFSLHSVPSLSNTATRSAGGTKPGEPSLLAACTNATIARRAGVSFQDSSKVSSAGGYGRAAPTKVDAYQPLSGTFCTSIPVCGASMR